MDFFEQWFGISPDHGDGSLEILWLAAIAIAAVAVFFRRRVTTWMRTHSTKHR
jgi:hypothetical protein